MTVPMGISNAFASSIAFIAGSRTPTINSFLDKVAAEGQPLDKVANINQGVVSGCDYVSRRNELRLPANTDAIHGDGIFVLDLDNPRDERVVAGFAGNERRLLRRFYKNSDISRFWCSAKTSKRHLYIGRGIDDLGEFPRVREHLKRFKTLLSERREVGNGVIKFYQLQWPRSEEIFTGPKFIVPYRSEENAFAYNDTEWFCRSDCYVITQKSSSFVSQSAPRRPSGKGQT
jgi:adenine-specific DNA-methyltransferase